MSEKKNIDRLFQEKLKDFEQKPSDLVWENINKELKKEHRSTRVIPLWLRISGVAAALLLFFIVGKSFVDEKEIPSNTTIVDHNNNTNNDDNSNVVSSGEELNNTTESVKNLNNNILDADDYGNTTNAAHTKKKNTAHSNSSVANNHLNKTSSNSTSENHIISNNDVANISNKKDNNKGSLFKTNNSSPKIDPLNTNNAIANGDNLMLKDEKNLLDNKNNALQHEASGNGHTGIANHDASVNVQNKNSTVTTANNAMVENRYNSTNTESKNNVNNKQNELLNVGSESTSNDSYANVDNESKDTNNSTEKNSLINTEQIDAVFNNKHASDVAASVKTNDSIQNNIINEELTEALADNDSIAKSAAENAIEKAIAEQEQNEDEDDEEEEGIGKRWSVAPSIAPVYYNTLSSGSPIDGQFASNDKRGDLNMSYGVNVGYKITDKLSVRSGINKFNVGYKTDNVVVRPSVSGSDNGTLKNVRLRDGATNLAIFGESSFNVSELPSDLALRFDAFLDQQISYYEVPMEMSYLISNKRLGVNIIGGFSTLFLNDNAIYAQQPSGTRILLGEANNLNSVSFSTNIGVGFNYKISKSFNFNLEPVFKYQLNSFSENSGGFKPYTLGIYSGFSFKF